MVVEHVENLKEAENCLKENTYDLYISDIMFTGKNLNGYGVLTAQYHQSPMDSGLHFYCYLKQKGLLNNVIVVVFTRRSDSEIKIKFIENGLLEDCFICTLDVEGNPAILYEKIKEIIHYSSINETDDDESDDI